MSTVQAIAEKQTATRTHGMRDSLLSIAAALGLSTICLAQTIVPLLSPAHRLVYHWSGPAGVLFGPTLVELLVWFLLVAVVLLSAKRQGVWRGVVWAAVLVFLPWIVYHQIQQLSPQWLPHWFGMPRFYFAVSAWPVLAFIWSRRPAQRESAVEILSAVLAFTALSSVLCICQLVAFWWQARGLNRPLPLHQSSGTASIPEPRVIVILMDELSYQQVYEHRFPGLQLPAFDALTTDSVVFTNVVPTANYTEEAIPALLTGKHVQDISAKPDGTLQVSGAKRGNWQPFHESNTVFADALKAGDRTALVGWYNPYCRILHDVLDSCFWTDSYTMDNGMSPERDFKLNLLASGDNLLHGPAIRAFFAHNLHVPVSFNDMTSTGHVDDYVQLMAAADKALLDRSFGFTFIHLPIPHPDGIYNRKTGQFTNYSSTYIDNLALADKTLEHIRSLLEQSGQWDSSTVVVMGDHGWRTTLMWRSAGGWSEEDERASMGGTFDSRPAFIVKLAGETSEMRIDETFDAVRTRSLLDQLIAGRIHSTSDLKQWVDQRPVPVNQVVMSGSGNRGR